MSVDKILTSVFCAFIFTVTILFFALPKLTFSQNEKRTLEEVPAVSVTKILDGSFEKSVENYLSDHFPFRDKWVAMNSYYQIYTGRNGANGVYKGKDGYIINAPVKPDYKTLSANLSAMLAFTEKTGIPSKLILVPSAGYVMDYELPYLAKTYHDGEMIDFAREMTQKHIGWIDAAGRFKEIERDFEPYSKAPGFEETEHNFKLYYKTDHHWTASGAYNAYVEYCKIMGFEPMRDFDIESYEGFYGTTYSKSALWGEKGESLEIWNYPHDVSVNIEGLRDCDDMFFYERLENMDKYPVFLDGNHSIERIVNNNNPDGKKLLLIKDSYAHSLAPFLIGHLGEIDMVDLRYYFEPVSKLAEENGYDEILYVYGLNNLCESSDASILE